MSVDSAGRSCNHAVLGGCNRVQNKRNTTLTCQHAVLVSMRWSFHGVRPSFEFQPRNTLQLR